jgi:hypothetical protein
MMAIAASFGSISALVGLLLSYHLNLASGPAIVLVETGLFGLAFLLSHSAPQPGSGRPRPAELRRAASNQTAPHSSRKPLYPLPELTGPKRYAEV